jgi:lysophospholipase L1-like esterase
MSTSARLIRIYGDSLSLPRPSDGLQPEQTYGELLRRALEVQAPGAAISLFNRSRGGYGAGDLSRLYHQDVAYFGREMDGLTVLQCGVVDCAPRPVPRGARDHISKLPTVLRWGVAKCLHVLRPLLLRAGFSWRATSEDQFEQSMRTWLQALDREKAPTYVLNITPALPNVDRHSPGLLDSIRAYNEILARCVGASGAQLIDAHAAMATASQGLDAFLTAADGYHLTAAAHQLIAKLVLERHMTNQREASHGA